ncbi:MAG: hypothetical protein CMK07_10030 [Ponticaulis sp.]|nr:hypothetical protein [Ponticaulis sp.]
MISALAGFHILTGSLALASGFTASFARKGRNLHKISGIVFSVTMLSMALTGSIMAFQIDETATGFIGLLTASLVGSSWLAVRRPVMRLTRPEMGVGLISLLSMIYFFYDAWQNNFSGGGVVTLIFGLIAFAAVSGDVWRLQSPGSPRQRLIRHLWRMLTGLAIAALSFFIGQQDEFPASLQGLPIWFLPPVAAVLILGFWLTKQQLGPRFKDVFRRSARV